MKYSFFGLRHSSNRHFKTPKHYVSTALLASVFRLEAPSLLYPLNRSSLTHWLSLKHSTSVPSHIKQLNLRGPSG